MAVLDKLSNVEEKPIVNKEAYPAFDNRLNWIVSLLSAVFAFGIYFDGWAHNNIPGLFETFFTPYHFLLYGGFFMTATAVFVTHYRNTGKGYSWSRALPKGYMLGLFGAVLFAMAGVADFIWHETFGFEEDIEALLSPSHLMLVTGAILLVSSPLRAQWQRADKGVSSSWRYLFPSILSMTLLLSVTTFFVQYTHFADAWPITGNSLVSGDEFVDSIVGIYSIVMPLAFGMGAILFLMQRWQLPTGTVTFILLVNYTLMFWMQESNAMETPYTYVAVAVGALLAEGVFLWLKPNRTRTTAVRLFAFLTPFLISSAYMIALLLTSSVWWEIHMWAGVPFLAGVAGLFLSFLAVPMPLPETEAA